MVKRSLTTIAAAGLIAGVLDATAATVSSGATPQRVFQTIASGLLGRSAYEGGWPVAALGVLLHFSIATTAAAVYFAASRRWPLLVRRAVPFGLAYGVAVYFFMRYVVLPLSAVALRGFSLEALLRGVVIHALCVGLPIALTIRWLDRPAAPAAEDR
jgi:uncharacterized membrane protein YagU involved in acid resistance